MNLEFFQRMMMILGFACVIMLIIVGFSSAETIILIVSITLNAIGIAIIAIVRHRKGKKEKHEDK